MVGQDDDATSLPRAQPRVRVHVRWAGRVAMFHVGPDVTVMQLVRRMVPPLPPLDAIFFCRNATRIELDASVGPGDAGIVDIHARLKVHALPRTIGPFYQAAMLHPERDEMLQRAEDAVSEVVSAMSRGWRQARPPFGIDTNAMVLLAGNARGQGRCLQMLDAVLEPHVLNLIVGHTRDPELQTAMAHLILRRSQAAAAAGDVAALERISRAGAARLSLGHPGLGRELAGVLFASCSQSVLGDGHVRSVYRAIAYDEDGGGTPDDSDEYSSGSDAEEGDDAHGGGRIGDLFAPMPVMAMEDLVNDANESVLDGITIDVDREHVLASSYNQVMSLLPSNLRPGAVVDVIFLQETGVGAGVTREWMAQTWRELTDPSRGLFEAAPGHPHVVHPCLQGETWQPGDFEPWMEFAGRMAGIAIRAGTPTGVHFSRALYRCLTSWGGAGAAEESVVERVRHLAELHPDVARSCSMMLGAADQGELDALMIPGFALLEISLLPGVSMSDAADVDVTLANRELLVRLVVDHYTGAHTFCRRAATAMLRGMAFVTGDADTSPARMSAELAARVSSEAFNTACGGCVQVSIEELLQRTRVTMSASLSADGTGQAAVSLFWGTVRAMSQEDRRALLRFWTGATSLAPTPEVTMDLVFIPDDANVRRLPSSHTCYMQMSVPCSADLPRRLRLAIKSCGAMED